MKLKDKIRRWLFKKLAKHLLNIVTYDEIFVVKDGKLFIGDVEVPQHKAKRYIAEASFIRDAAITETFLKTLSYGVQERILKHGASNDDLLIARAIKIFTQQYINALHTIANLDKYYNK